MERYVGIRKILIIPKGWLVSWNQRLYWSYVLKQKNVYSETNWIAFNIRHIISVSSDYRIYFVIYTSHLVRARYTCSNLDFEKLKSLPPIIELKLHILRACVYIRECIINANNNRIIVRLVSSYANFQHFCWCSNVKFAKINAFTTNMFGFNVAGNTF